MTRWPMVVVVASALHACGYDGEEVPTSGSFALTSDGTLAGTDADDEERVTAARILDATTGSPWAAAEADRFVIVDYAAWSVVAQPAAALAGEGGTGYARWLYRATGSRNIAACARLAPGACLGCRRLGEATTVSQLVEIFAAHQGWVAREAVGDTTIAPADYVVLGDGRRRPRHVAVVMAVAADRRWLFTVDGSDDPDADERVRFRRRAYRVDGALAPDILGVGKIDVTF